MDSERDTSNLTADVSWHEHYQRVEDERKRLQSRVDELEGFTSEFGCEAWTETGPCPGQGAMLMQFTGAIHVRVQLCPQHWEIEQNFRNGEL